MAATSIEKPTPFAEWMKTKALFDDAATATETQVTDGPEPGLRYACGKSSAGWCFYIAMTSDEEPVFWEVYRGWLNRHQGAHHHVAVVNSRKPPNCGTPDTPVCEGLIGPTAQLALDPTASHGVHAA